jgi:hypothetical protein
MLTKTDFLTYLDTPLHLWAMVNDKIEKGPSAFDQHLMAQGLEVEEMALAYLRDEYLKGKGEISIQQTYQDGPYQVRVDGLLSDPTEDVYDIYEVKSSTSIKKEHYYDVAFQRLVLEASLKVRDVYLVYVNKDYLHGEELVLDDFFVIENLNEEIEERREEVLWERENALKVVESRSSAGIIPCNHPGSCPSPALCFGDLPDYPIYNLPRLSPAKKKELRAEGVFSIKELPADYELSGKQELHRQSVLAGQPIFDKRAIQRELESLEFPLYFMDYETYATAFPLYPGYKPYQHVVFQYSLHIIDHDGKLKHHELLLTGEEDPGPSLAPDLLEKIGKSGSVLVWNKSFEMGKTAEMAERYPIYREGLIQINERIYDLMEIFSRGYYVDPGFKGSASLKAVLPVFLPEFENAYEKLTISGGTQALLTWGEIYKGKIPEDQLLQVKKDMLAYCELDTLAMVEIWGRLRELCS